MTVNELLNKKSRWTTGASARNKNHQMVAYDSEDAVKWCLSGAILKCYGGNANLTLHRADQYARHLNYLGLIPLNDNASFKTVRKLIEDLDI